MNKLIRQSHRWLSLTFAILVVIVTVAVVTQEEPAPWVLLLPVPPLLLLLASGLYLFVLPCTGKRRVAVTK
ncbi:hypothetical protein [Actinoplanes sp. NPDC051494]|uniref:hypothetical protein n=1 Tax=Actinoplanes sp. NPDC051494 TaxID=3363907 RepID=UPI00379F52A5